MSNLTSTTSITYTLTPSTFNLFKVEARYFIKRFAWRLNEIRGSSRFEEVHLFQGFWLAERSINDQSEMLSQMSRCDSATRTCLCVHALFCMILSATISQCCRCSKVELYAFTIVIQTRRKRKLLCSFLNTTPTKFVVSSNFTDTYSINKRKISRSSLYLQMVSSLGSIALLSRI